MLGITDPKISQWVQERLTSHPYSTYEDPPPSGTLQSASIPRTYIHCTQGPISSWMEPFAARASRLGWGVHSMAVGHDVTISHPDKLAKTLIQIARWRFVGLIMPGYTAIPQSSFTHTSVFHFLQNNYSLFSDPSLWY
jgi:hypothetical protein